MNRLYCISTTDNFQVTNVRVWTLLYSSRSDDGSAQVNSHALASCLLGSSTVFSNRYLCLYNTVVLKGVIWFRSWPLDSKYKTLPPMLYFLPGWVKISGVWEKGLTQQEIHPGTCLRINIWGGHIDTCSFYLSKAPICDCLNLRVILPTRLIN